MQQRLQVDETRCTTYESWDESDVPFAQKLVEGSGDARTSGYVTYSLADTHANPESNFHQT